MVRTTSHKQISRTFQGPFKDRLQFFKGLITGSYTKDEKVNNPSSLKEAEGDEEYVSLTMLKQMLSVQESILKALFHLVISSVTRVHDLLNTVTELKTSLEFTHKNVEKLDTMAIRVKLAPFKRLLTNKVLRWNILKTKAELEFQEYRNRLMKRG